MIASSPVALARIELHRPGLVPYAEAFAWQQARATAVRGGAASEVLALLQHPPVFTLGMRGRRDSVLEPEAAIEARGASIVQSDRGGDVTFHGPGQLVAYPILDLRARGLRPATYVRMLEQTIIDTLAAFEVRAERVPGRPGVWVTSAGRDAKIAAVGVRVREGVSTHGIAINVSTDLRWFDAIVPCGIADAGVTSIEALCGAPLQSESMLHRAVEDAFAAAFARLFAVGCFEVAKASVAAPSIVPSMLSMAGEAR